MPPLPADLIQPESLQTILRITLDATVEILARLLVGVHVSLGNSGRLHGKDLPGFVLVFCADANVAVHVLCDVFPLLSCFVLTICAPF